MARVNRLAIIILSLILATSLASCASPQVSAPTATTTPVYYTHTFILPAKGDYSFPIYLRNNETLHLIWRAEEPEAKVWFHIITPSGKALGFYEDDGHYANGTLEEGFCRGQKEGMTQFKPSDYGWGEGYYTMMPASETAVPLTVRVEYWIETR